MFGFRLGSGSLSALSGPGADFTPDRVAHVFLAQQGSKKDSGKDAAGDASGQWSKLAAALHSTLERMDRQALAREVLD